MGKELLHGRVDNDLTLHPPSAPAVGETMDEIRRRAKGFVRYLIDVVPEGRELSMVLTDVENACQHAIAGIARNQARFLDEEALREAERQAERERLAAEAAAAEAAAEAEAEAERAARAAESTEEDSAS